MPAINTEQPIDQKTENPEEDYSGTEPQVNLQDLAEEIFRLFKKELAQENERTGR